MAQLHQELEDLPSLLSHQENPSSNLNRDVGRCRTCCNRWSTGNPLPHALENENDQNAESRGQNTSAEEAGEGSSDQPSPPGSLFTDDPLLPKTLLLYVDWKLIEVYGDTMHDNDSSHLDGGMADDSSKRKFIVHTYLGRVRA
eukprot:4753949-Ditylum_brightwellii.AAC.1